jgi:O-antigen ligase
VAARSISEKSAKLMVFLVAITSLAINPFNSYEPFNAPKFLVLAVVGSVSLFLILWKNRITFLHIDRNLVFIVGLFSIQSMIILFTSDTSVILQLYGIDGRNTGFLTYIFLLGILVYFAAGASSAQNRLVIDALLVVGVVNAIYGLIQYFNMDPFAWTNAYSPVFGFFGNPNFQAALMGISGSATWALLLKPGANVRRRVMLSIFQILFIINIVGSKSQQGFILLGAGFVLVLLFSIKNSAKYRKFVKVYIVTSLIGSFIIILDILQKVPWNSFLYKISVTNRGDLWRAATKIGIEHPFNGVGFDGFEYFFREYRDSTAVTLRGAGTTSNSAHNVFLDLFVNGGFPLLIIYFGLIGLVIRSIIRVVKRESRYSEYFVALSVSWICYQLQSLISINQIGIAIWGWVLSGAIVGYEFHTREKDSIKVASNNKDKLGFTIIPLAIGLLIGVFPIRADINFRSAIESKEIEKVLNSAYQWPQSPQRMFQVAGIFRQNDLNDLSYKVAKDAVTRFPRSFENWEILLSLNVTKDEEKQQILEKMRELDPANPNI